MTAAERAEIRDTYLADFVGDAGDVAGFVLFDDERRYWIDLPRGW
jgi:hypothetical protein